MAALPELPEVAGVNHRYLEVDGIRFHIAEAGVGEPLVMLHGWPQNWYMWRRLVAPLGERYRLIMPDLRGLGWSDAPPSGYNKERLASDVLALLDQLGVDRFRLMGHDWGGLISYFIALRENSRVERLMPLNIIHPWPSQPALLRNLPKSIYAYRNALGSAPARCETHRSGSPRPWTLTWVAPVLSATPTCGSTSGASRCRAGST